MAMEPLIAGCTGDQLATSSPRTEVLGRYRGRGRHPCRRGRPPGADPGEWVPGAVVIDVGINRLETGASSATSSSTLPRSAPADHAGPGRSGPMTVATLMQNTLEAAERADAAV